MPSLSLFSAGSNAHGQLATCDDADAHNFAPALFLGAEPAGALPLGTTGISHIACGANHTLALLTRTAPDESTLTELWGCGDARRGQLGPSPSDAAPENVHVKLAGAVFRQLDLQLDRGGSPDLYGYAPRLVAAGWETSYIVLSRSGHSDVLLAMGADDFGDLGVGGKGRNKGKEREQEPWHVVELADASKLPSDAIMTVDSLTTGSHTVIACISITVPSQVYARETVREIVGWGTSRHGQLGRDAHAAKPPSFCPSPHPVVLPAGAQECGRVAACALGTQHTVFLHASGRLTPMGANRKGQLHGLELLDGVCAVGCTWNGTYAVMRDGALVATGSHVRGPLGASRDASALMRVRFPFEPGSHELLKIVCGSEHVLCLFALTGGPATEVWGWGWNEHGNLGIGSTEDVDEPVRIWPPVSSGPRARKAVDVWAGCGTSWILVER